MSNLVQRYVEASKRMLKKKTTTAADIKELKYAPEQALEAMLNFAINCNPPLSVSTCTSAPVCVECAPANPIPKKGDSAMYIGNIYVDNPTENQVAIGHILTQVRDVASEKREELAKQFGMTDDDPPQTFNEWIERLTAGKFAYPEDRKSKKNNPYYIPELIRWRDPSVKEDEKGYDVAVAKLEDVRKDTVNKIVVSTPADALKVLEEFKSTTIN